MKNTDYRSMASYELTELKLESYAHAVEVVGQLTNCRLTQDVYDQYKSLPPRSRLGFLCNAAVARAECDLDAAADVEIDAYLENLDTREERL